MATKRGPQRDFNQPAGVRHRDDAANDPTIIGSPYAPLPTITDPATGTLGYPTGIGLVMQIGSTDRETGKFIPGAKLVPGRNQPAPRLTRGLR